MWNRQATHATRERLDERLPDGREKYRLRIKSKPVGWREGSSPIRPIEAPLGDREVLPGFGLSFDEYLIGGFARQARPNRPVMRVQTTGRDLMLTPLGGGVSTAQRFTRPVLTPYLDVPVRGVIYPGLWPNAHLAFEYAGHAVHKYIILDTGHPTTFRFALNREGLHVTPFGNVLIDTFMIPAPKLMQVIPSFDFERPQITSLPLTWQIERVDRPGDRPVAVLRVDLPPGDWTGYAIDPTVIIQPGASEGQDTKIDESNPTTNHATDTQIRCGVYSSSHQDYLIEWPLGEIPVGSEIHTMDAYVNVVSCDNPSSPYSAYWHRVLVEWREAEATWNLRQTGTAWNTAGCQGAGADYFGDESVPTGRIGQYTYGPCSDNPQQIHISLGGAGGFDDDVQLLFEAGFGIHGFSLANTGGTNRGHQIASSDHATASLRPELDVVYTPPSYGRLWAYSINPLNKTVEVMSARGPLPPEEVEPDNYFEVAAPSLPTPSEEPTLNADKRFAYAEEVTFTDPDGIELASSTSQFADVVVARAAGRNAL